MVMRVYGDRRSGNCLKVAYTADRLGIGYDWTDVDLSKGETRTEAFLTMNPAGQVPVVVLDDGRPLAQSNAIIRYLARDSALLPADAYEQAKVDELLFWEQYSHEPYVAVCRYHMVYLGRTAAERDADKVARGEKAIDFLERALTGRTWLVGDHMSVADISLLAYTRLAPEGGFDLSVRPAVTDWIARCEAELAIEPLPALVEVAP